MVIATKTDLIVDREHIHAQYIIPLEDSLIWYQKTKLIGHAHMALIWRLGYSILIYSLWRMYLQGVTRTGAQGLGGSAWAEYTVWLASWFGHKFI